MNDAEFENRLNEIYANIDPPNWQEIMGTVLIGLAAFALPIIYLLSRISS